MKKQRCFEEICIVIVLLLICAYVFFTAGRFRSGSGLFPRIVSALTASLCFFQLGVLKRELRLQKNTPVESMGYGRNFLLASGTLILYTSLIFVLGYYVATAIYLCGTIYLFGYRKKMVILFIGTGLIAFIYGLFNVVMYVKMPSGLLF